MHSVQLKALHSPFAIGPKLTLDVDSSQHWIELQAVERRSRFHDIETVGWVQTLDLRRVCHGAALPST